MAYTEYLSPEVIELQQELVLYHPTLCRVLALIPEWEERLAAIATHVDAQMDGDYSVGQITMVIAYLLPLLQLKREVQPGQQADYKRPDAVH
jgi:hypothetical protein